MEFYICNQILIIYSCGIFQTILINIQCIIIPPLIQIACTKILFEQRVIAYESIRKQYLGFQEGINGIHVI